MSGTRGRRPGRQGPNYRIRITKALRREEADRRAANFRLVCSVNGLPDPVREHRFATPRKWRFDYAWPASLVALEVEGGVFSRGRHVRGRGYAADMVKYSSAAALGWRLIRVQPKDLCSAQTVDWLKRALKER